jgi:hypothetical protein
MLLIHPFYKEPSKLITLLQTKWISPGSLIINTGDLMSVITELSKVLTRQRLLLSMERNKFSNGEEVMISHLHHLIWMTKGIQGSPNNILICHLMLSLRLSP